MMHVRTRTAALAVTTALLAGLLPADASAQIGNPLPQATGMAGNYTALARGFAAPAWNPAGLGMPDNPEASFTLLPVRVGSGIEPIGMSDFGDYSGEFVPHEQRVRWLDRIVAHGGETGNFDGDLTYAALSVGPVALTAGSSVRARVNMGPDAAELFLFGNAGLTGEVRDYTLDGSRFDVAGTTTFAASVAAPLSLRLGPLPDQHFALGATVKYTLGNFLVLGEESGSMLGSNPLELNVAFPVASTPLPDSTDEFDGFRDLGNNGSGIGLDVGAAWQGGIFSAGVVVRNLVNTFEWDTDRLEYREGVAVWNADTAYTSFEPATIDEAPAEIEQRIAELYTFSPVLAAGVSARVLPILTVTGDMRHALEENLDVGARSHLGVGAELTALPFLPIRAGVAAISGGYQLSAGLGIRLGALQISAAGAARQTDLGEGMVGSLGLTYGVR